MSKQEISVVQMQGYIQQLKKLDELISLHKQHGGEATDFMVSQYTFSKEQLLKDAVLELIQHDCGGQLHGQMILLQKLLGRFVGQEPVVESTTDRTDPIRQIEILLA